MHWTCMEARLTRWWSTSMGCGKTLNKVGGGVESLKRDDKTDWQSRKKPDWIHRAHFSCFLLSEISPICLQWRWPDQTRPGRARGGSEVEKCLSLGAPPAFPIDVCVGPRDREAGHGGEGDGGDHGDGDDEGGEDCDDFNKDCTGGETSGEGRTVWRRIVRLMAMIISWINDHRR